MRDELIRLIYEAERLWRAQDETALRALAERVARPFLEKEAFAERVPWAWAAMATSLKEDGRPDAARALAWSAIAVGEPRFGEAHPQVRFAIETMAQIVYAQGELEEALSWEQRALRLRRQAFGNTHPSALDLQEGMAVTLLHLERYDAAAAEAEQVYDARVATDGAKSEAARTTARLLAKIHTAWDRADVAATWQTRADPD
jgi:tetratricopeptide (TPR) repeat protein